MLKPFDKIIGGRPLFVYDRRLKVHYVSESLVEMTMFPAKELIGQPATKIIGNGLGTSIGEVHSLLLQNYDSTCGTPQFVMFQSKKHINVEHYLPPDECRGRAAWVQTIALDSTLFLGIIFPILGRIYRRMGQVSSDVFVTVDNRNRIVAFNEVFFWLADRPPLSIFHKPLRMFFQNDVDSILKKHDGLVLREREPERSDPWETLFSGDVSRQLARQWQIEKNLKIIHEKGAVRFESRLQESFVSWRSSVDHNAFDLRWEMETYFSRHAGFCFYFNGAADCVDAAVSTPDITGYLIGLNEGYLTGPQMILKRWGKDLVVTPLPFAIKEGPITLAVEKSRGFFRLFLDGRVILEYCDPQYVDYGQSKCTGFLVGGLPVRIRRISFFRRPSPAATSTMAAAGSDFIFRKHPELIFSAEIFQRQVNRTRVKEIYFRRVTELRKTQQVREQLLSQQAATLRQIDQELKVAATVLNRLLPRELPKVKGVKFASYFLPSSHVGGDLYDVFEVAKGQIAILMYDVSGHGVPAALISVMFRTLFQKYFNPRQSLKKQLVRINQELYSTIGETDVDMGSMMFVTVFYGLLNVKQRVLQYIGAGMPSPMVVKRRGLALLHTKGTPLGMFKGMKAAEHRVRLVKGEKLILFTDGLTEIFSPDGKMYDKEQMSDLVRTHRKLPLAELVKHILHEHTQYLGDKPPRDDVTLLGIEIQ